MRVWVKPFFMGLKMITQKELKEILRYDAGIGAFFWISSGRGRKSDKSAGSYDAHGYGQVNITHNGAKKSYKEHRLVWLYVTGEWPPEQIDHIDQDRRNNRFENLRLANNTENHQNRPMQRNNKSGFVGVHLDKSNGLYKAYIHGDGKRRHLGWFKDIDEAIEARKKANIEYGFHENHGSKCPDMPKNVAKRDKPCSPLA